MQEIYYLENGKMAEISSGVFRNKPKKDIKYSIEIDKLLINENKFLLICDFILHYFNLEKSNNDDNVFIYI